MDRARGSCSEHLGGPEPGASIELTDVVGGNLRAEDVVLLDHFDERQGTELGDVCGGSRVGVFWRTRCEVWQAKAKNVAVVELRS